MTNPIQAVTLVGLICYGSMRLAAGMFYGSLGFSPEDVGLGYAQILSTTFLFLLSVAGIALVYMAAVEFGGPPLKRLWRKIRGKDGAADIGSTPSKLEPIVLVVFVMSLGFTQLSSYLEGMFAWAGLPRVTVWPFESPWEAQPALVNAVEGSAQDLANRCVLYLGQADGVMAIFDPKTDTSWRVPVGSITVQTGGRLAEVQDVIDGCPPKMKVTFPRFLEAVNDGDLVKAEPVTITSTTVTGAIRTGDGEQSFAAAIPPGYDQAELLDELMSQGYDVDTNDS